MLPLALCFVSCRFSCRVVSFLLSSFRFLFALVLSCLVFVYVGMSVEEIEDYRRSEMAAEVSALTTTIYRCMYLAPLT